MIICLNYLSPILIAKSAKVFAMDDKIKWYVHIVVVLSECFAIVNSCVCYPFYRLFSLTLLLLKRMESMDAAGKNLIRIIFDSVVKIIAIALSLAVGIPGALFFPLNALTKTYIKAIEKTAGKSFLQRPKQEESPPSYTQGGASKTAATPKENQKYILMAEGLCERMIQKDLGKFLLEDFHSKTALTQEDLENKENAEKKLRCILREIYAFLALSIPTRLVVEWSQPSRQSQKTQAGSFSSNFVGREIKLIIEWDYSPDHVMAILCHECTHAFMQTHNLNWQDMSMNEERTDIMAVLLGFGNYMRRGYQIIHYTQDLPASDGGRRSQITRKKVGYISSDECCQVQKYLAAYRREFIEKKKMREKELAEKECFEARMKALRRQSEELLNCADRIFEQSKRLIETTPTAASAPIDYLQIAQLLSEYEGYQFEKTISEQKRIIADTNNDRLLENANTILKKQCAIVSEWIYKYKALNDTEGITHNEGIDKK